MTHDPLCVCSRVDHQHFFYTSPADVCMACHCDDIASVRADEREQAAQRIEKMNREDGNSHPSTGKPSLPTEPDPYWLGWFDAVVEAIAAARGEAS